MSGTGHFAHIGGDLAGLILAWHWGFRRKHLRDYYLEHAEDLAQCPLSGAYAAHKTYLQALEVDPENPVILRELARTSYWMGEHKESLSYYRRSVQEFAKRQREQELAEVYAEAFERYHLIFLSEAQLELVRLLLKAGKWKLAERSLNFFCAGMELKGLEQKQSSVYIQAKLILAWILDSSAQDFVKAKQILIDLLQNFPAHPLLKYPAEVLERYSENNRLFNFNPTQPGYPFQVITPNPKIQLEKNAPSLRWYKVRPRFIYRFLLVLLLSPVLIGILVWLTFLLVVAGDAVLGIGS